MLRIGTDCSGIEAPIEALRQLKIPYEHVFSSEIDKFCIKSIKANYTPKIIFGDPDGPFKNGDIRERNIKDVPDIDLYVCGFPCQPFSIAGERKGFEDKRGNVFFSCLEIIEKKQPKYFILENVKGLKTHDKGNTWKVICEYLFGLEKYGYIVKWKILNTRDYGIPQNRERIFIVGSKDKDFAWPKEKVMDDIKNYIDDIEGTYTPQYIKSHLKIIKAKNPIFIDSSYPKHTYPNSDKYCSTITTRNKLWCILKNRQMTINECLVLQGFTINFKRIVSLTQLYKQLGNSISVNVLIEIFKMLI